MQLGAYMWICSSKQAHWWFVEDIFWGGVCHCLRTSFHILPSMRQPIITYHTLSILPQAELFSISVPEERCNEHQGWGSTPRCHQWCQQGAHGAPQDALASRVLDTIRIASSCTMMKPFGNPLPQNMSLPGHHAWTKENVSHEPRNIY